MKKFTVKCKKDYVEDGKCFWTAGKSYECRTEGDDTYEIKTNFGGTGLVGEPYMLDNFKEYFEVVE